MNKRGFEENMKREEKEVYRKALMKYLCPICENKPVPTIILENASMIPLLVKGRCQKCGYVGMLVEVPLNPRGIKIIEEA